MQKKLLIIRVISIIVIVIGMITLASGLILHALDKNKTSASDGAQMPEEYIEEFFSNKNSEPEIENYIEPEYQEEN